MQLAIIGASTVGRALASSTTRAGHTVTASAARPEHAQSVAQQTGAQAAGSNRAAVAPAELVILAVPSPAVDRVLADLGDARAGKVLVDAIQPAPAGPAQGALVLVASASPPLIRLQNGHSPPTCSPNLIRW